MTLVRCAQVTSHQICLIIVLHAVAFVADRMPRKDLILHTSYVVCVRALPSWQSARRLQRLPQFWVSPTTQHFYASAKKS